MLALSMAIGLAGCGRGEPPPAPAAPPGIAPVEAAAIATEEPEVVIEAVARRPDVPAVAEEACVGRLRAERWSSQPVRVFLYVSARSPGGALLVHCVAKRDGDTEVFDGGSEGTGQILVVGDVTRWVGFVGPGGATWWTEAKLADVDVDGDGKAEIEIAGRYEDAGAEQFATGSAARLVLFPHLPESVIPCDAGREGLDGYVHNDRVLIVEDGHWYGRPSVAPSDRGLPLAMSMKVTGDRIGLTERWTLPDGRRVRHRREIRVTAEGLVQPCPSERLPKEVFPPEAE